jgi:DNA-binding protein H-NS
VDLFIEELKSLSSDELWDLHQQVALRLVQVIAAEKSKLEERLRKIQAASSRVGLKRVRRPYPPVLPKYQNPNNPAETWSGRGRKPLWVKQQLRAGKKLDRLLIARR